MQRLFRPALLILPFLLLGSTKCAEADVQIIITQLSSSDPAVRESAVEQTRTVITDKARAVPILIGLLKDSNWPVRTAAARELALIGDEAIPKLITAVDAGGDESSCAAMALEQMGARAAPAIPTLALACTKAKWELRAAAARALGGIGIASKDSLAALYAALNDDSPVVGIAAADAFGMMGPAAKEVVPVLINALNGRPELRLRAARALGRIGPDAGTAIKPLTDLLPDPFARQAAVEALVAIGSLSADTQTALISVFQKSTPGVRLSIAKALGASGNESKETIDTLILALHDPFWPVSNAGTESLVKIGPPAVPALLDIYSQPNTVRRFGAENALRQIAEKHPSSLKDALKSKSADVRVAVVRLIGILQNRQSLMPLLVEVLTDRTPEVREAAVETFANAGSDSIQALVYALKSERDELRAQAVTILGRLGPLAIDSVPALIAVAAAAKPQERSVVFVALGDIGPGAREAAPMLVRALTEDVSQNKALAARALGKIGAVPSEDEDSLIALSKGAENNIRISAAQALGKCAGTKARDRLVFMLKDLNEDTRAAVVQALGNIGKAAQVAVPYILIMLQGDTPQVRAAAAGALSNIGSSNDILDGLTNALKDDTLQVREKAAMSLAQLGIPSKNAISLLGSAMSDKNDDMRRAALAALTKMGPDGVGELARALDNSNPKIRNSVYEALSNNRSTLKYAVPAFSALVATGKPFAREAVLSLISMMGPDAAAMVPSLVGALNEIKPLNYTHVQILSTLGKMGPLAKEAVPVLLDLLKSDYAIANASATALAGIGADAAPALALFILKEDKRIPREMAIRAIQQMGPAGIAAIPSLISLLKNSQHANLETQAREAIVNLGPAAYPAIIELLDDQLDPVRGHAYWMIGKLKSAAISAAPVLVGKLGSKDKFDATKALISIGPASIPSLIAGLSNEQPEIRRGSAEVIGTFGPAGKDALPALNQALKDSSEDVRLAVQTAIGRIDK